MHNHLLILLINSTETAVIAQATCPARLTKRLGPYRVGDSGLAAVAAETAPDPLISRLVHEFPRDELVCYVCCEVGQLGLLAHCFFG